MCVCVCVCVCMDGCIHTHVYTCATQAQKKRLKPISQPVFDVFHSTRGAGGAVGSFGGNHDGGSQDNVGGKQDSGGAEHGLGQGGALREGVAGVERVGTPAEDRILSAAEASTGVSLGGRGVAAGSGSGAAGRGALAFGEGGVCAHGNRRLRCALCVGAEAVAGSSPSHLLQRRRRMDGDGEGGAGETPLRDQALVGDWVEHRRAMAQREEAANASKTGLRSEMCPRTRTHRGPHALAPHPPSPGPTVTTVTQQQTRSDQPFDPLRQPFHTRAGPSPRAPPPHTPSPWHPGSRKIHGAAGALSPAARVMSPWVAESLAREQFFATKRGAPAADQGVERGGHMAGQVGWLPAALLCVMYLCVCVYAVTEVSQVRMRVRMQ